MYNALPLPVFSPLDGIEERTGYTLGDLNYVTKPYRSFQAQLGYTGPGWQHRVQTEWLLYAGQITWQDISHTLTASAHIPADLFARPLRQMEEAWEGSIHAKRCVNSLIGLWCLDELYSHKVVSSSRDDDCPAGALKRVHQRLHHVH